MSPSTTVEPARPASKRTTKKGSPMPAGVDAQRAALEQLVQALEKRIGEQRQVLKVDDLVEEFRRKTDNALPGVVIAVEGVRQTYAGVLARENGMLNMAASVASNRLGVLLQNADAEIVANVTDITKLREAEEQVAALEAELSRAMRDLEAAVDAGDVDAVLQLRTRVEAVLPGRLAQAKVAVITEQIALAEAAQAAPIERAKAAETRRDEAIKAVEDARRALEEAAKAARDAAQWLWSAQAAATTATTRATSLREERDRLQVEADQGQAARLRRLAGLEVAR